METKPEEFESQKLKSQKAESEQVKPEGKAKKLSRRRFLKGVSALTLVGLGNLAVDRLVAPKPRQDLEESHEGEKLSKQEIKQIFRVNPEKYGFVPIVQIKNPEDRYLIHIAQTHASESVVASLVEAQAINRSQENIRQFVLDSQTPSLFCEGVGEETVSGLNQYKEILDASVFSIKADMPNKWQRLKEEDDKVREEVKGLDLAVRLLEELVFEKAAELARSGFPASSEEEKQVFDIFKTKREVYEEMRKVEPPTSLFGFLLVHLRGEVALLPAEAWEENKKVFEVRDRYRQTGSQEDREKYLQANLEREKVAIDLITESEDFKSYDKWYLVYGAWHDFSQEVEEFNRQNPDKSFGLIYLLPRK